VSAQLARRAEREDVARYLSRDSEANLFLLDLADGLGGPAPPGELRTEIAVARSEGRIVGVASLRPAVAFDAGVGPAAVEALLPLVESLGVGLVKSPAPVVDALWALLGTRGRRRVLLDRLETAYRLRPERARIAAAGGEPRVRSAVEADLDALVYAARESLREEDRPDPFTGDSRGFRRWVRGRLPRARVLDHAGRIVFVGYADVRRREGWLIQGVYTWPDARGRGFARAGVSDMCREAFAAGADHVQLAVVDGNVPARRLYEGLGFTPFGQLRTVLFAQA
jgi:RimJ/RimL family protein N-acetyltransferase